MITFFVEKNGIKEKVEASIGDNLMFAIGTLGDCGGECICSTCHVKIDPPLPNRTEDENFTLDIAENVEYNSRLSCQVVVDELLSNRTVRLINNEILY